MKRIIYLVCIHLLCSTAAQASNLRQISSREGISNNAILSLAQDKHGFIWVGSCDGLNMWDGERMRLFPNDWGEYTPLSGNLIEEIAVTTDSLFWIRTNYGLDLFDPDSKHVEPHTCFQGMYRVVTRSSDEVIVITQDNKFRYYSPEMGIYISSDPIGLAGGFNTYAYVKDTNTWVDVLGLSGELVYQLIRDNKVVYYGITSRTALERMAEHGKTKVFDNMEILADGLTHDQARSIEGALIRQRLKERADDWSDFDSIKARLDKSGLDNRNRGRIKERWTSENPLDDLRDKIYKKPKKVKVGCKS